MKIKDFESFIDGYRNAKNLIDELESNISSLHSDIISLKKRKDDIHKKYEQHISINGFDYNVDDDCANNIIDFVIKCKQKQLENCGKNMQGCKEKLITYCDMVELK